MIKNFSSYGLVIRLVISAVLYSVSFVLYYSVDFTAGRFLAFVTALAPLFILYFPGVSTRPKDRGEESWCPVTMNKIDSIIAMNSRLKSVKIPFFYNPVVMIPFLFFLLFFLLFLFSFSGISFNPFILIIPVTAFIPFLFYGYIRKWYPARLINSIKIFEPVYSAVLPENFLLVPYLRFDRDKSGLAVPEDVKFIYEPRRDIKGFNSVQFILTWNNGPKGSVPYLYAVLLFTDSDLREKIMTGCSGYICEIQNTGENGEIFPLVIRQNTSGSGYHTTKDDVHCLVSYVIMLFKSFSVN